MVCPIWLYSIWMVGVCVCVLGTVPGGGGGGGKVLQNGRGEEEVLPLQKMGVGSHAEGRAKQGNKGPSI